MRPLLVRVILAYCKLQAKKNPPHMITEEEIKKDYNGIIAYHQKQDKDVLGKKDTVFKGLNIEQLKLNNTDAWIISKDSNPSDKIVYYIHGGGFSGGCTGESSKFIAYFVKHFNYNVCSIDYREIPEVSIKEILDDCLDAYKELLKRYAHDKICFMGESAGGHLVFSLSHKLKDEGIELPGGIIACSPVMQFQRYAYSYYECSWKTDYGITFGINERIYPHLKGDLDYNSKFVSPLLGDFTGFPKVYLDSSNIESLRDEARMTYVKLKEVNADVEYHELDGFFHAQVVSYMLGYVRRKEYPLIKKFLNKVFN